MNNTMGYQNRGPSSMRFDIISVENGQAYGRDQHGKLSKIPLTILPAKSPYPKAGEQWLVNRESGIWTFSHILNAPPPPTVTGHESDSSAYTNLLEALGEVGLIIDETIKDGGGGGYVGDIEGGSPTTEPGGTPIIDGGVI